MPNCKPNTVISKDAKKCPDCGAKIKMINSESGSMIAVDNSYISVWTAVSNGHNGNAYKIGSALRAHSNTCVAKNKFRKPKERK